MKLLSWNVNGLRAVEKKGFLGWFLKEQADIVCLQETKATLEQLKPAIKSINGYVFHLASAQKKGYSGAALWSKEKPQNVISKLGIKKFDAEGRILAAEYKNFSLFNVYFPNGNASPERLKYKMEFYTWFLNYIDKLKKKGKRIIFCGDVNTAHKEIDLSRPKENSKTSGFLPQERAWIDKAIEHGYIDTFRMFNDKPNQYSWWDYKTAARARNVGWRLDYFFISDNLKKNIKSAFIQNKVMGSDHCPVGIELSF